MRAGNNDPIYAGEQKCSTEVLYTHDGYIAKSI